MTPVPFDLPVRTGEAGALARILYEHAKRPLTEDLRNRLAVRAGALKLESIRPFFGSLERDPIHPQAFYLAVDGIDNQPLLMRFAPSSTPSSGLFPKAVLIGRLRVGSQETVINAVPFAAADGERIRTFAWQINSAFLPKVQGAKSTVSVPVRTGIFDEFRSIAKPLGLNVACVSGDLDTILWEAIRSGWRDGYSAESSDHTAAGYSRYIQQPGEDLLARLETIARSRVALKLGRTFDWELQLDETTAPAEAERIIEECRTTGKPPQYLGFTSGQPPLAEDWLALARKQTLGISFSSQGQDSAGLTGIARAVGPRFNCRAEPQANPQQLTAALFG